MTIVTFQGKSQLRKAQWYGTVTLPMGLAGHISGLSGLIVLDGVDSKRF